MAGLVGLVPYGTAGSVSALAMGVRAIAAPIAAAANHGAAYLLVVFMLFLCVAAYQPATRRWGSGVCAGVSERHVHLAVGDVGLVVVRNVVTQHVRGVGICAVLDLVAPFTAPTRAEEGNLWFEWSRGLDNPAEYVLVEAFRDGDAGAAHVNSDLFKAAQRDLPQALAHTPKVISQTIDATGWSKLAEISVD